LIDLQNGGINNSMPHTKMKKFQLLRYVKSRLSGQKNASEISPGGKALASTVFVCVAAAGGVAINFGYRCGHDALMQFLDGLQCAALAIRLSVEDAIYSRLRRAKLGSDTRLAPACLRFDLLQ
jgi:hypothetical protein